MFSQRSRITSNSLGTTPRHQHQRCKHPIQQRGISHGAVRCPCPPATDQPAGPPGSRGVAPAVPGSNRDRRGRRREAEAGHSRIRKRREAGPARAFQRVWLRRAQCVRPTTPTASPSHSRAPVPHRPRPPDNQPSFPAPLPPVPASRAGSTRSRRCRRRAPEAPAPAGAGVARRKHPLPWSPGSQSRPVARSPPGPAAGSSAAQPIPNPTNIPVPAPMRIRREPPRIRSACPSGTVGVRRGRHPPAKPVLQPRRRAHSIPPRALLRPLRAAPLAGRREGSCTSWD